MSWLDDWIVWLDERESRVIWGDIPVTSSAGKGHHWVG